MASNLDNASSFLSGTNAAFIEQLYDEFLRDPGAVDPSWARFFSEMDGVAGRWPEDPSEEPARAAPQPRTEPPGRSAIAPAPPAAAVSAPPADSGHTVQLATLDSIRALMLIRAYRVRGHLIADLDPLNLEGEKHHPELDPHTYGFTDADFDRSIYVDGVLGLRWATLREVVDVVKQTYCGRIGIEFMHIQHPDRKAWIQHKVESSRHDAPPAAEARLKILREMEEAEGFEKFLDIKYRGAKRFSLEGSESIIPAINAIIEHAAELGVCEIVIGMAHRGRLNALTSIMGKSYAAVFSEFETAGDQPEQVQGSGDVKYHLGASADREMPGGQKVHISLTPNPSHLEAVNPVVLGKVRAKQTLLRDKARKRVMGLLLHGDAAFAGQGLCAETFELSELRGYRTGGTLHIVINNQIGFTTSPSFARSSPYPSDVAKVTQVPIFHVNGDDPEAVVRVCCLAVEYRQRFNADVVVDVFCYRRHGHNEGDEPAFTQPLMYRAIRSKPTTLQIYIDRLVSEEVLAKTDAERMSAEIDARLEADLLASKSFRPNKADWLEGDWSNMEAAPADYRPGETAVPPDTLREIGRAISRVPEDFNLHPRIKRQLEAHRKVIDEGGPIDWAMGEALAFGSLLLEGNRVRLSGQDCSRGTFSQRHAGLFDQETEHRHIPLNFIRADQAKIEVSDSMLSEAGVLGFEYGFSIAEPGTLVLWEAQFGDFANGAQVIIDQFIAAGESKWLRMSGLVMLLPHGFEGQGPEHSSARMERYLQLYAENNIQVANCTTPASYFHVLRRQMRRNFRKPLIVMSPKSLLRYKRCVSTLDDLSDSTHFHRVISDHAVEPGDHVRRIVLSTGKVYYDLLEAREKAGIKDVALVRVEQIAPFPDKSLTVEFARHPNAEVVWCQEEPKNMGAWTFISSRIEDVLAGLDVAAKRPRYVGRPEAASTATGFLRVHIREQNALVDEALAPPN